MLPSLIYLAVTLLGLGVALSQHGKPKSGNENAVTTIITSAIIWGLLYWGGFFNALISAIKGGA